MSNFWFYFLNVFFVLNFINIIFLILKIGKPRGEYQPIHCIVALIFWLLHALTVYQIWHLPR